MINLIKRDLILQKRLLWLYIPFIIFLIFAWSSPFLIFTVAALYIPFNALASDEKVASDTLLNSLPYTRFEIITARYLGALFYTTVSIGIVSILLVIFNEPFTLVDILIGTLLFLILAAFTFPLFQLFNKGNVMTIIILIFIVGLGLVSYFSEYLSYYGNLIVNHTGNFTYLITVILMIIVITFYFLSWLTTYSIYNKKDF